MAPGRAVTTPTFNGQLPGPLLRCAVGQPLRIDIHNDTALPERINWYGQDSYERDMPAIEAGSRRRVQFTPRRQGLYLYHSDVIAATHFDSGLYSGLIGGLLVEPPKDQRRREREYILVLKECEPFLQRTARGCEVGYGSLTINGRLYYHGMPLDSGVGEPMLLHVLNASATEIYALEIPGRSFEVLALDDNPVPRPDTVTTLYLAPGERVTARAALLGGTWLIRRAGTHLWDYSRFDTKAFKGTKKPDVTLEVVLSCRPAARSGFNRWYVNGNSFALHHPCAAFRLQAGLRYRLALRNSSDELISLHLQRHQLQIVTVDGTPVAGILKDIVCVGPQQRMAVDLVADSPGPALLHCTRQLHKDFGLMALVDYT